MGTRVGNQQFEWNGWHANWVDPIRYQGAPVELDADEPVETEAPPRPRRQRRKPRGDK